MIRVLDTRTVSLTPGTPGRRQQIPRMIRSTLTPACEARYSASMIWHLCDGSRSLSDLIAARNADVTADAAAIEARVGGGAGVRAHRRGGSAGDGFDRAQRTRGAAVRSDVQHAGQAGQPFDGAHRHRHGQQLRRGAQERVAPLDVAT